MSKTAPAACLLPPGDITQNGSADVVDVQCAIVSVLWSAVGSGGGPTCLGGLPDNADLDCDGTIVVADAQIAIMLALGAALAPFMDANTDGCVDACTPKNAVLATIVGTSGAPIEAAVVKLSEFATLTNPSGVAVLAGPPAGAHILVVTHPDYAPASFPIKVPEDGQIEVAVVLVPAEFHGPFSSDAPIVVEHALARVEIPGGGVVLQDGSPASGPIEVRMAAVDPTIATLDVSPGPLLGGVAAPGSEPVMLEPLYMVEVTLFSGGEPAKLAPDVTATLHLPITTSLANGKGPGDVIPAWWYDVDAGVWHAEGEGVLLPESGGLVWVAQVSHFTWWMGGIPWATAACVRVLVTHAATGDPVAGATIKAAYANGKKQKTRSTDESGTACLNFSQGGAMHLSAYHPAIGSDTQPAELVELDESEANCNVDSSGCMQIALALSPQACLRGTALWPDGTPAADHTVFGSMPFPDGAGTLTAVVHTEANGSFCMTALPGANTNIWSTAIQDGTIFGASAVVAPSAGPDGCAGFDCVDVGVLTLKPRMCGDPDIPAGCFCALAGTAGEVVDCPLCLATTADNSNRGTLLSGVLTYDANRASLSLLTTVMCFTEFGCFEVDAKSFPLPSGHSVSTNPSSLKFASGSLGLVLLSLSDAAAALTDATTDGAGAVASGAPIVLTLKLALTEDVSEDDPLLVCMDQFSVVDGSGQKLGSYILHGIGTTSNPFVPSPGTHTGCPPLVGDITVNGKVDVVDVKCSVANVLATMSGGPLSNCNTGADPMLAADVDCSGSISLTDLYVTLVAALGGPFPPDLDVDGDGCIDHCSEQ